MPALSTVLSSPRGPVHAICRLRVLGMEDDNACRRGEDRTAAPAVSAALFGVKALMTKTILNVSL